MLIKVGTEVSAYLVAGLALYMLGVCIYLAAHLVLQWVKQMTAVACIKQHIIIFYNTLQARSIHIPNTVFQFKKVNRSNKNCILPHPRSLCLQVLLSR